jgi:hypothetical protein
MIYVSRFQNEGGMALLLVLVLSAILLTSLAAGYSILTSTLQTSAVEMGRDQVISVGLAGIEDTLAWFRSGTYGKPAVKTDFDPKNLNELRGTIKVGLPETQDSSLGIVRDFPIGLYNNLFGHYEVRKVDVQDITSQRFPGSGAKGLVWSVEVKATVYRQLDSSVSYNQNPNQVLRTLTMGTEVRRLALTPPLATLTTFGSANIQIEQQGRIRNDNNLAGVWVLQTTMGYDCIGVPGSPGEADFCGRIETGIPKVESNKPQHVFDTDTSLLTILGMPWSDLLTFVQNNPNGIYMNVAGNINLDAQLTLLSNASNPPIIYLAGSGTAILNLFSGATAVNTYGAIVTDGVNLIINGGPAGCWTSSCGQFTGLIYVSGNFTVVNGATISGAVVVLNKNKGLRGTEVIQIGDSGVGLTKIKDDSSYITSVLTQTLGNYSLSKAPHVTN